ncbi:hypothetical protein [Chitinibacter tainanensis]|uniref:hypothetical protein n=1 Tax=Chitinibacter tainanensis TaxID=230667 RepID=UPI0005578EBE|nr:hypothetical protein [Chitinibacter tainanensis]
MNQTATDTNDNKAATIARLKQTMPWKHQVFSNGLIKVLDKHGNEVMLIDILTYLEVSTLKLANS